MNSMDPLCFFARLETNIMCPQKSTGYFIRCTDVPSSRNVANIDWKRSGTERVSFAGFCEFFRVFFRELLQLVLLNGRLHSLHNIPPNRLDFFFFVLVVVVTHTKVNYLRHNCAVSLTKQSFAQWHLELVPISWNDAVGVFRHNHKAGVVRFWAM